MSMPRSRPAMRKVSQGRLTNLAVVIVTVVAVDLLVAGIFYNFTHNGRATAGTAAPAATATAIRARQGILTKIAMPVSRK